MDKFTKIVLSAFEPFIGHHQGLVAYIKRVIFKECFRFIITLQNYVNIFIYFFFLSVFLYNYD